MNEENITRIFLNDKEYILIGTAHVSKNSAEQVKEIIEAEQPDSVCIELDQGRYQSITEGNKWKDTDIFKIIKEKRAGMVFINLALSSFQKRMADQMGIKPGQEMIQGIESAKTVGAKLILADRNIQTTFSRIWHSMNFKEKMMLLTQVIAGIFTDEKITEEDLEQLKTKDSIDAMLNEFTENLPQLKKPLIDERDQYLAEKIRTAPGEKVVAVLGAAHVPGVSREIEKTHDLTELTKTPPKSKKPKIIGWSIPVLIIAIIVYTFFANPDAGMQQTWSWILWHGSLSALGAALAFGHPLTILTAFVAAPITALNPLLASGWFAGLVQAFVRKPTVGDFENLSNDISSVKGFWNNKVTRILLIIILSNIGSSIGTFIGGADVLRLFFKNF
ncbi:TraB/GumN family protein [Caldifermentibacillus hisashii]|jgi:pheromone shutdown-related protein TraB|uniref:TraB/GumN family protein n=1 Tax=Caldifermentibacillus hisashii TaxID=996558 RepID=UPI0017AB2A47|nr:TraB/GumN family protein [Caldibacillus thermoamylovorans]NWN97160.1 TraB/GumN family protein [Bacillus sp. (in: firmicutes)]